MITQRELDLIHIQAQNYAEEIKAEFQRSLMGNRQPMQPQIMQKPMMQQMTPQQGMMSEEMPMMGGGQYG